MLEEIKDAIQKNLSAEVGKVLQSELTDLELLRSRIKQYEEDDRDRRQELDSLRKLKAAADGIINREKSLALKEAAMDTKEAVFAMKDAFCQKNADDLKDIVSLVFTNNKYKYTSTELVNGYNPNGNTNSTHTVSKTKEG